MKKYILAFIRQFRNHYSIFKWRKFGYFGHDIHVSANIRMWAPNHISIGNHVYLGKGCHVEANLTMGDYCLVANDVGFVGRYDHDYKVIGVPVRYSPWIVTYEATDARKTAEINIGQDVWIGYRSTILAPVKIGKGAIVAAGSVVVNDVEPYSIVAGVPARVVGRRFESEQVIQDHEQGILNGHFSFSEKGLEYCVIRPGSGEN